MAVPRVELTPGEADLGHTFGDSNRIESDWSIPLEGYSFECFIEVTGKPAPVALTLESIDLVLRKVSFVLSKSVSMGIPVGNHRWYKVWTDPAGMTRTVLHGVYRVTKR